MNVEAGRTACLRRAFRILNRFVVVLWRLGLGSWMAGPRRGYVMVLVTTGRRSGLRRPVPVNFAEDPGSVYCLAGFGMATHWLMNLLADPRCELWLPDGRRLFGTGEIVTDEEGRVELVRRILIRAGFATTLAEPGLDLQRAGAAEISSLGERYGRRYEVVQIRLDGTAVGPDGPGDLAWVFPAAAIAGSAVVAARWRRRPS